MAVESNCILAFILQTYQLCFLPHTLQAKELTAPFPACLRRRVKGIRTYIFLHVEYFSIDLMKHTRTRGSDHPTPLDPPPNALAIFVPHQLSEAPFLILSTLYIRIAPRITARIESEVEEDVKLKRECESW